MVSIHPHLAEGRVAQLNFSVGRASSRAECGVPANKDQVLLTND